MKIDLTICGLAELPVYQGDPWTHVISIWDRDYLYKRAACRKELKAIAPDARLLFCFFEDTDNPVDPEAPKFRDVHRILKFTSQLPAQAKLLVHCRAGISRSTATAYAILCQHSQPGSEPANMRRVESLRELVMPNRLIVTIADKILKRDGAMLAPLRREDDIGTVSWFSL